MRPKTFIVNDGKDYYLAQTYGSGEELQKELKEGTLTDFTPIYKFDFLDVFRNKQ